MVNVAEHGEAIVLTLMTEPVRPKGALVDLYYLASATAGRTSCEWRWWLLLLIIIVVALHCCLYFWMSHVPTVIFVAALHLLSLFCEAARPNCVYCWFSVCYKDGTNRFSLKRAFDWWSYHQIWLILAVVIGCQLDCAAAGHFLDPFLTGTIQ